jgi:hypothetical protein
MRIVAVVLFALVASVCGQVRIVTTEEVSEGRERRFSEPTNLGFERLRDARLPESWRVTQSRGPYRVEVDELVKRSGKRSAKIAFEGTGAGPGWGAFNQDLEAERFAGKMVVVTAWIRTQETDVCKICSKPGHNERSLPEEPRSGAQVRILAFASGEDDILTETLATPLVMGTRGWTRFQSELAVPTWAETVIIAPNLWGRGTAWFDDVAVKTQ